MRVRRQARRGARRDDASTIEDHEAVDHALGLADVVRDEQHARTGIGQRPDLVPEQASPDRVDVVGGLVEHDQSAGEDRRHAERREACDAAGDLLRRGVRPRADVERVDEVLGARGDLRPAPAADPADELDRRARRQARDRDVRLGLDRGPPTREIGPGDRVDAVEGDRAGVGSDEADDLVDEGRLACAVVPEEADHLTGCHVEVDAVVRLHAAAPGIALAESADREDGAGFHASLQGIYR